MSQKSVSRRRFLSGVAAGSTGAALASVPSVLRASDGPATPETMESYPIAEPGKGAALGHVKIVAADAIPQPYQEKIRAYSPGIELVVAKSRDEFRREMADTHVIYGGFSRQELAAAKELRWVQWPAAGVEYIAGALADTPIVLTNMQRRYSPVISETAIALMLALARRIPQYSLQTHDRQWQPATELVEISGMTLGLAGMGGIGCDTAYRAHYGFNMRVLGVDPKPLPKPAFVEELHSVDWLPKMAPQVDILMSAAPHTPQSEGMFNESIFRSMKRTAFFINMSRGMLVDTPALVRALEQGWIAGAGLDVAYKEPLPPDDPLWRAPNVIITCHTSGQSPKTEGRLQDLFAENVRRYVAGLPLLNVVDKKRGY